MSDATLSAQPTSEPNDAKAPAPDPAGDDVIELHRRTIDKVLIGFGALTTVVFLVAGGLLAWGANFSDDYVHRELASQNVFFPSAEELKAEGRDDLVAHADEQVTTGTQAEAYASYIGGHLEGIADGKTYSEIDDRGAAQAVQDAIDSGASDEEVADLQATADQLKAQRDTLFKGETLRGLLLSSYAWSTVGRIAGYAAIAAFVAAAAMGGLTIAGLVHLRRQD
ncbi:MAG TPA: hypothetical protein VNS19_04840 [Acidimicrobiales bacterium]|jgi:hypothetical protein|nr:hypothetical protein [Acidimicrobiales bacterium]